MRHAVLRHILTGRTVPLSTKLTLRGWTVHCKPVNLWIKLAEMVHFAKPGNLQGGWTGWNSAHISEQLCQLVSESRWPCPSQKVYLMTMLKAAQHGASELGGRGREGRGVKAGRERVYLQPLMYCTNTVCWIYDIWWQKIGIPCYRNVQCSEAYRFLIAKKCRIW